MGGVMVNEDIYDADPEFRYLALSLTVKNRSEGEGVGGERAWDRLWRTDTFVNTATEARIYASTLRNGPDNNAWAGKGLKRALSV